MNEINETVTISIENYNDLLESDTLLYVRNDELKEAEKTIKELKTLLLESNLDEYAIKNFNITSITDITSLHFGVKNVDKVLKAISYDELIEFIENKKKEFEER